ncbi:hypothetical protein Taro_019258 [Colocasia esculenta]|uniref:Uncharacterized protein n=1 Tax=Colocasia esculenta TaxID=4460 RepID=A0A843UTG7_COLES|nr:hypothetical protein [Colocasia esculenta]
MKGECPEIKNDKYKKNNKLKKLKVMIEPWSDEDQSEDEEENSSSSINEELCFMANSSDGKVYTNFSQWCRHRPLEIAQGMVLEKWERQHVSTARKWLSTGAGFQNKFLEPGQYLSIGMVCLSTGHRHMSTDESYLSTATAFPETLVLET